MTGGTTKDDSIEERLRALETQERARPINASILARLRTELPGSLKYHTAAHTNDVLHEVLLFGLHGGLGARELELLAIAAAYHDAGFLTQVAQNEQIGAKAAVDAMTASGGYSSPEKQLVQAMIEDTQLKRVGDGLAQIPTTELSKYLCDADLSNLGRTDFLEKAELVRQELGAPPSAENSERVLKLVQSHQWYTEPARLLRQEQKERNIQALRVLIEQMRKK